MQLTKVLIFFDHCFVNESYEVPAKYQLFMTFLYTEVKLWIAKQVLLAPRNNIANIDTRNTTYTIVLVLRYPQIFHIGQTLHSVLHIPYRKYRKARCRLHCFKFFDKDAIQYAFVLNDNKRLHKFISLAENYLTVIKVHYMWLK